MADGRITRLHEYLDSGQIGRPSLRGETCDVDVTPAYAIESVEQRRAPV